MQIYFSSIANKRTADLTAKRGKEQNTMDNYIIKGVGTIDEIITALNALKAVEGGNKTISELGKKARYLRIREAIRKQINNEK